MFCFEYRYTLTQPYGHLIYSLDCWRRTAVLSERMDFLPVTVAVPARFDFIGGWTDTPLLLHFEHKDYYRRSIQNAFPGCVVYGPIFGVEGMTFLSGTSDDASSRIFHTIDEIKTLRCFAHVYHTKDQAK